eukprot:1015006-Rhodomonas_salina.1
MWARRVDSLGVTRACSSTRQRARYTSSVRSDTRRRGRKRWSRERSLAMTANLGTCGPGANSQGVTARCFATGIA